MFKLTIPFLFLLLPVTAVSLPFPEQPVTPRMVNDFSRVLQDNAISRIEHALVNFYKETSTQIAIVTVDDLSGYAASDYAFRLAEKWGIGQRGKNNGILVLVKPKSGSERGEAFIAVGYGLEGVVPDAVARRIVQNEMIPNFQTGNYAGGLIAGVNVLMEITRGEYTADKYMGGAVNPTEAFGGLFFIIILFLLAVLSARGQKARASSIGKNLPFLVMLSMLGSGSRHSGRWDSFSSGSGRFSGGGLGGGFGGFGGGSFGGGGAGGSW